MITVIFGTVALATAYSIFAPWLMIPSASTFVPTMKPGTSIRNTSGMPKALHKFTKRAALSAESLSRMPAELLGLVGDDARGATRRSARSR